eukprot:TRINITY_DN465_c0_g1_i1.p1 TRINITY_DN465_c0_g1~~TRINITY_DN465_c0_g1_i1.p1  ORF type:complete len:293 (-),score=96.46 TRINITY_DN465_c0_g1_i1:69-947(-)
MLSAFSSLVGSSRRKTSSPTVPSSFSATSQVPDLLEQLMRNYTEPPVGLASYKATIVTGQTTGSGTKASITIQIYGTRYFGNVITFDNLNLQKGTTIEVEFEDNKVGEPRILLVEHLATRDSPSWFLESITITVVNSSTNDLNISNLENEDSNQHYFFNAQRWLSLTKGQKITKTHLVVTTGETITQQTVDVEPVLMHDKYSEKVFFKITFILGNLTFVHTKSLKDLQHFYNLVLRQFPTEDLGEFPNGSAFDLNPTLLNSQSTNLRQFFNKIILNQNLKDSYLFQNFLNSA